MQESEEEKIERTGLLPSGNVYPLLDTEELRLQSLNLTP